jgi:hypothetical protein
LQYDPVFDFVTAITDHGGKVRKQGKEFKATCPAHDDKQSSLQIGQGDKGAVIHCHAGCAPDAIVRAVGWTLDRLYAESGLTAPPAMPSHAAAPGAEATYVYDDERGAVLFRVERRKDKKGGKTFVQARPDPQQPGHWLYSLGNTRRVPYRLSSVLAAAKAAEWVFVVEGEKDVERLEREGLVATCNPGGAGKFQREFGEHFMGANVVVIPDNDEVGLEHAHKVIESLAETARSVSLLRLEGLPEHGDVSDWLEAEGNDRDSLMNLALALKPLHTNKPVVFNAEELMKEEFPEIVMAVPGVIAEGCTFLVGAPKIGKSWMSLGLGLAVAQGSMALGTIPVVEGKVLYLALEDTPRRLQRRLLVMIGSTEAPANLNFACTWPRLNAGGLDQLEQWLQDNLEARMVIIDTWAKVKSAAAEADSMYQADYSAVSQVKALADKYSVPIVLIHHQRKAADGDPLNTVAGSTGLTGAADATVILSRPRGAEEGHLYVTGRDVEESKSIVSFDATTGQWTWLGEADDVEESKTEDQVIKLLTDAPGPVGPKEVADALKIKEGTAKWLLAKLTQEDKITRISRGKYVQKGYVPVTGVKGAAPQPIQGVVVAGVQPPLPGTGGASVPTGPMALTDAEVEEMLAAMEDGFEGVEVDEEEDED